jgi:hypothetical protein
MILTHETLIEICIDNLKIFALSLNDRIIMYEDYLEEEGDKINDREILIVHASIAELKEVIVSIGEKINSFETQIKAMKN